MQACITTRTRDRGVGALGCCLQDLEENQGQDADEGRNSEPAPLPLVVIPPSQLAGRKPPAKKGATKSGAANKAKKAAGGSRKRKSSASAEKDDGMEVVSCDRVVTGMDVLRALSGPLHRLFHDA